MDSIRKDRDRLHSALADLMTFLDVNPHPMKAAISTYLKTAEIAIEVSLIGEEEPIKEENIDDVDTGEIVIPDQEAQMKLDVASVLRSMDYSVKEAKELAEKVSGDTVEDRVKNALMSTTTMRTFNGRD